MQKTKIIIFLLTIIYISSLYITEIEFEGCEENVYEIYITLNESIHIKSEVLLELSSPTNVDTFCEVDDDDEYSDEVSCLIADKLSDDTITIKNVKVNGTDVEEIKDLTTSQSNVSCEGDKDVKKTLSSSSNIKINRFLLFFIFFIA